MGKRWTKLGRSSSLKLGLFLRSDPADWLCIGMLKLRARRLEVFSQVPGNQGSELRLRCRREYWEVAQELASRLNMRTLQQQLQALVAETDRATQRLPQPPASVEPQRAKREVREKQPGT